MITFNVERKLATLSEGTKGWSKQFNLISWNGREAKYDIRDWDETGEKMGRGISLSKEELKELYEAIANLNIL